MSMMDQLRERAKKSKKTIILPESMDKRTFKAAQTILKDGLANLIIIGTPQEVEEYSKGCDITGATIIDPNTYEKTKEYEDLFVELRKSKGLTHEDARKQMLSDYTTYGCLMLKAGDADGLVSGACHSTANTLRPALQIIKTKPGTKLVSGFFVMEVPNCEFGENGVFVFADCSLEQKRLLHLQWACFTLVTTALPMMTTIVATPRSIRIYVDKCSPTVFHPSRPTAISSLFYSIFPALRRSQLSKMRVVRGVGHFLLHFTPQP